MIFSQAHIDQMLASSKNEGIKQKSIKKPLFRNTILNLLGHFLNPGHEKKLQVFLMKYMFLCQRS